MLVCSWKMHPIGVIAGSWAYACACSCFHLRENLFLLSYQWKKRASMFWGIRQAQQWTTSSCQIQILWVMGEATPDT